MNIFNFFRRKAKSYVLPIDPKRLHTLHVGINEYQRSPLKLCVNDVNAVKTRLQALGIPEQNMVTLLDKTADTQNMKYALNDLLKRANAGDVVVVQYSGHGSQLPCLDEEDGKMELLCPADIHRDFEKYNVSDDFLSGLLVQLSARRVTTYFLPFDCCHTGGMTRLLSGTLSAPPNTRFLPAPLNAVYRDPRVYRSREALQTEKNSIVMLGGCAAHEVSYEYALAQNGALTWSLLTALENPHKLTSRTLHKNVHEQVTGVFPDQHPVLEGNPNLFDLPLFTPLP
jgi:uncharacterized caspase-like protein